MKYFYVRVSTKEQNLDRQLMVADGVGVDRVFCDKRSGKDMNRPRYRELKSIVRPGDEIIVKELDRLGRNLDRVKEEIKWFSDHGVILRIMNIPTTMMEIPADSSRWVIKMINNILIEVIGSVAEQERNKIRERQAEGIRCMERDESGKIIGYGRKRVEITGEKRLPGETVTQRCERLGISRSKWYNM